MKKVKVGADVFCKVLASTAIANGKGFIFVVNPGMQVGDEKQDGVLLASCDGVRLARGAFSVELSGVTEQEVYYPHKSLKKAADTLAKITSDIVIELKESCMVLSTENGENRISVPLNSEDIIFDIPQEEFSGATSAIFDTEDFAKTVKCGGVAAAQASEILKALFFNIAEEKMRVTSSSNTLVASADVAPKGVKNPQEPDVWYPADDVFVLAVVNNLSGEQCQVTLSEKYMVIADSNGMFYASRRKNVNFSTSIMRLLDDQEHDYTGMFEKSDLLLGIEIATVGVDKPVYVTLTTEESGELRLESANAENRAEVKQSAHEGFIDSEHVAIDLVKLVLSGCGPKVSYASVNSLKKPIHISSADGNVSYRAIIGKWSKEKAKKAENEEKAKKAAKAKAKADAEQKTE